MYRVPLFQGPEYKLLSTTESDTKTVRIGRSGSELHWREDNYRPKKVTDTRFSHLAVWAPNIGYSKARAERQVEFDNALNSFIREVDRVRTVQRDQ